MDIIQQTWDHIVKIRKEKPLIAMLTNIVSVNFSTNILLSIGASPIVTIDEKEIEDIMEQSAGLVLNMGTLDTTWEEYAKKALIKATEHNIPSIFDPVGVGFTKLRNTTALSILKEKNITALRGNASEIASLAEMYFTNTSVQSTIPQKGVDSQLIPQDIFAMTKKLASALNNTIMVSGPQDIITNGKHSIEITGGNSLMPSVTGMGCALTATISAMLAVERDPFTATAAGTLLFAACGAKAGTQNNKPGTFPITFLDTIHTCTKEDLTQFASIASLQ
ncbi:MAG: hydroxyethylthiazole kinase [Desulfovibrionaceae bacterium]